jgi:hypothetical protein
VRASARSTLLLALGVAAAACASSPPPLVDFSGATKHYRDVDYPKVHKAWTRHAKLVEDVGTVMEIWATLKSWDFRQAYVAKYAKAYDLPEAERETLSKSQHDMSLVGYEIHLVAQSTTDRWNDLDRRNSPWRITLLDGTGAELSPTSVKAERLPEIYESEFFPDRTPFSRTYTLRFVHAETAGDSFGGSGSGRLILRVASPMGSVEASWEARGGPR